MELMFMEKLKTWQQSDLQSFWKGLVNSHRSLFAKAGSTLHT